MPRLFCAYLPGTDSPHPSIYLALMLKPLLTGLLLGGTLLAAPAALAQKTYLHCGRLLDMRSSSSDRAQTAMTLVVENGRILAVEKGYSTPTGAQDQVIDLKNRTVLPGLIDCHVHLEGETSKEEYLREFTQNPADVAFGSLDHARKTLLAGFTTVRDLGGSGVNVALRNAINQGKVVGPRIFTAPQGHFGHRRPHGPYQRLPPRPHGRARPGRGRYQQPRRGPAGRARAV